MIIPRLQRSVFLLKLAPLFAIASVYGQNYSLQTLYGGPLVTEGGSAFSAVLRYPVSVAADSAGNVYIADREDNRVWRVDVSGVITTLAGSGVSGYAGDTGPAAQASLNHPTGVAVDLAGNVYICDTSNNVVRRVTPDGMITTAAGNGTAGHSGDNGPARKASILAQAIAIDPAGNLLISEGTRVRQVSAATGNITTIAGTGTAGYSGDVGLATKAKLSNVTSIAVDGNGQIYLADTGVYLIRYIDTKGVIRTIAGYGASGESGDGNSPTSAKISPSGMAVNAPGTLIYLSDSSVGTIRRIDLSADTINLAAGLYYENGYQGDGMDAGSALLWGPTGLAMDTANNLLICDTVNQRIRKISSADNTISTVAGGSSDALLNHPEGISVDGRGNLYIADTGNNTAKQLTLNTAVLTSIEKEPFRPEGVAADGAASVYITSQDYFLYKFTNPQWAVVAGNGSDGYSGDGGSAYWAQIGRITSLAMDKSHNLFIADYENHVVRKIDTAGKIALIAGNGSATASGDGGAANAAGLDPFDIAPDSAGNLFIADRANHRVRKVSPDGAITTVAGTGVAGYSGDNGPATQATINSPTGVAVDSAGNLYIADNGNGYIRVVTRDGTMATGGGTGTPYPFNGDGPAPLCNLSPYRIAIDGNDNIYVADWANDRIRQLVISH
jgi:sugar lactone lactonase YvrE